MKKITCALAAITSSALLFSCNDKLNIAAPYKNITVVYGLLNQADTAHYIRIQKAFMDENQSGITMAKEADSSFYRDLSVSMKVISNSGTVIDIDTLKKVDLTLEGYPKEPGAFFNTPNYAYKFTRPLVSDFKYRLVILNTATGNVDSAETPIINSTDPNTFSILEWLTGTSQRIAFPKTISPSGSLLESRYNLKVPAKVGAVQLILRFRWIDSNTVNKTGVYKTADFTAFSQAIPIFQPSETENKTQTVYTQNKNIYDFLRESLGANPGVNQIRYMLPCHMIYYVAGTEYKRYNDLNSYKGGLTSEEIRPVYTNIKGANVMGLFSTRTYVQKLAIPFSEETKDSVKLTNVATKDLNIEFLP